MKVEAHNLICEANGHRPHAWRDWLGRHVKCWVCGKDLTGVAS